MADYTSAYNGAQIDTAVGKALSPGVDTVTQSGDYTPGLSDAGRRVKFTNTDAATLTIPTSAAVAFPAGTEILITRYGAGTVTIAGASGVTLHSMDEAHDIAEQYVTVLLKKEDTDEWSLWGYLA
jgi:hypothetical protein